MTDTTNLGLPCIEGSQAQKHITHNDALRILDTLVQLAVLTRTLTAPPGSPADGQRWIVKAGATDIWVGHDNAVAAWQDGAWQFSTPQTGWCAFVVDEGTLLVWNGSAWGDFFSTVTSIQNLALLGIGTTADSSNPLSAKLNAALFVAKTVAESGSGDLRYTLSKESVGHTLSLLFQDNYSGRAEIGLTGDDDFHFKVSPDGSTWYEALKIASATGKVSFPVSGGPREVLTANRTYYVRTDGSDSNNGLANTSGGAFLTIQKAIDTVTALDLAGYNVTIQVADGTYTGNVTVSALWVGRGTVTLQGNTTTPANCVLSTTGDAITVGVLGVGTTAASPALLALGGFKITTASNGNGVVVNEGSRLAVVAAMEYGSVGGGSHFVVRRHSIIVVGADYKISGSALSHFRLAQNAIFVSNGRTVTLSGSPVFSGGFGYAQRQAGAVVNGMTFSGSTGSSSLRYGLLTMGMIDTGGGGASYLPGDTAGTNDGTGVYA
jgi:Protein of unknown function (DUF2793)